MCIKEIVGYIDGIAESISTTKTYIECDMLYEKGTYTIMGKDIVDEGALFEMCKKLIDYTPVISVTHKTGRLMNMYSVFTYLGDHRIIGEKSVARESEEFVKVTFALEGPLNDYILDTFSRRKHEAETYGLDSSAYSITVI